MGTQHGWVRWQQTVDKVKKPRAETNSTVQQVAGSEGGSKQGAIHEWLGARKEMMFPNGLERR